MSNTYRIQKGSPIYTAHSILHNNLYLVLQNSPYLNNSCGILAKSGLRLGHIYFINFMNLATGLCVHTYIILH